MGGVDCAIGAMGMGGASRLAVITAVVKGRTMAAHAVFRNFAVPVLTASFKARIDRLAAAICNEYFFMALILLVGDFPKVEIEVLAFADFCFWRRNAESRRLLCGKSKGRKAIASLVSVPAKATDAAATATTPMEKNNEFFITCSIFLFNNAVICITVAVFPLSDKRTRPNGTGPFEITATNCGGIPLVHPESRERRSRCRADSIQVKHPTSRCCCNFRSQFSRGQIGT